MRIHRSVLAVGACVLVLAVFAWAQPPKAGLYETTSNMTWQVSPFPNGMTPMHGPHTKLVCVTQEEIDKFGTVPPQTQRECEVTNVVKKTSGMTAELVCTGPMSGKGDIQASWDADYRTTSKIHFTGKVSMGAEPQPFEWTVESTSVYKGADCGNVKP
jgi:hypothetical protein